MKINFKDIILKDLEWNIIENSNIHKVIANLIYSKVKNLDLIDYAFKINKWKDIDITKSELEEIKNLCIEWENFSAFVRKGIKDFIDNIK